MEGLDEIKDIVFHYARCIWKNRWIGLIVAWVVMIPGVILVDQLQDRFKAETKVYIDSTSVLKPLLKGLAIQSDLNTIVQLMAQQLTSRPNLTRAVQILGMDNELQHPGEMEQLVDSVSRRIYVESPHRGSIYTISYQDESPVRAKQMVEVLLNIFVEDTLGKTGSESDTAIEFLDAQIEKYDGLLRAAEQRLEEFKRKNIGLMPEDGASYYSQLQDGSRELDKAKLSLAEAVNRREEIERKVFELKSNRNPNDPSAKSSLELRVDEQETAIDELLLQYTDAHPDVINARQVLQSLKARLEKERGENGGITSETLSENPVYQKLQILLTDTEANISSFTTRVAALEEKQTSLKKLVDIVPKIEADLQRLNRDYEVHKTNYNELVKRREQAKISEDVETGTDQIKFRIIEPPYVPQNPHFPNRPLFDVGVLIFSLGIGYGISLLVSFFQPVFYNQKDIRKVMSTPILGSVQKFDTPAVVKKRIRNLAMFSAANIALVCLNAYLVFNHYRGVSLVDFARGLVV